MKNPLNVPELTTFMVENISPWVLELNLSIERTSDGTVDVVMRPAGKANRVGGILSGQAIMAAADTAMVLALTSQIHLPAATVDMSTSFLRPALGEISMRAETVKLGRQLAFMRVALRGTEANKLVATAVATYAIPRRD